MSTSNTDTDTITICAACGKEGKSDNMNTCNKCKSVKYCNASCKKKHRKKHKKACERRVAELYDEKLFKEVEPEECPICFLPMPIKADDTTFESCCGKRICNGCIYAMEMSEGKDLCAFCRTPLTSSHQEHIKRAKKLMDNGNAEAFHLLAGAYANGTMGITQNWAKAHELHLKAGELGSANGYFHLGFYYNSGRGVEVNKKKSAYYYGLAAMMGSVNARNNLAYAEVEADNPQQALKHWVIAARAGHEGSLEWVKQGFMHGDVTKDVYEDTLYAYQKSLDEMKSDDRDKAKMSDERRREG